MVTSATTKAHPRTGRRRLQRTAPLVATPEEHRTEVARGRDAPAPSSTRSIEARRLLTGGDTGRRTPAPREASEGSQPLAGRDHSKCTVGRLVATPYGGHRTEDVLRELAAVDWTRSNEAHRLSAPW